MRLGLNDNDVAHSLFRLTAVRRLRARPCGAHLAVLPNKMKLGTPLRAIYMLTGGQDGRRAGTDRRKGTRHERRLTDTKPLGAMSSVAPKVARGRPTQSSRCEGRHDTVGMCRR